MPLTADSLLVRNKDVHSTPLDRDLIVLNVARDNYVGLDDIGRQIWDLLAEPREARQLCDEMTRQYRGEAEKIAADLMTFLNDLVVEGLLVVVPHGIGKS
jgi:hypothetical protein